jgi:hypothetical protein
MEDCQYFPVDWSGRTKMEQRELFDQILTYFTQNELHKTYTRKIQCDEWLRKGVKMMRDFAHFYACNLFDDILIFYDLPELECGVKNMRYFENKNILYRTYAMYDDYFEHSRYTSGCKYDVYLYINCFTAY